MRPTDTGYARENRQIAGSSYSLDLEEARIRDLSGTTQYLEKNLHFNRYQTGARSLLGLIYYGNSRMADALVRWIIGLNLQPGDDLTDHYLDETQRKPGQLETEGQSVKASNQALWRT